MTRGSVRFGCDRRPATGDQRPAASDDRRGTAAQPIRMPSVAVTQTGFIAS